MHERYADGQCHMDDNRSIAKAGQDPPIRCAGTRLEKSICALQERAGDLERRLEPVMSPANGVTGEPKPDTPVQSEIAAWMDGMADRIDYINRHIDVLMSRLEI